LAHCIKALLAQVADGVQSISMSSPSYRMGVNRAETPGTKSEPTALNVITKINKYSRLRANRSAAFLKDVIFVVLSHSSPN